MVTKMATNKDAVKTKEGRGRGKEATPEATPDTVAVARSFRRCRQEDDQGRQEARLCHHDEPQCRAAVGGVSSDQIEDIYAMPSEMGINVVEAEEAEPGEAAEAQAEPEEEA